MDTIHGRTEKGTAGRAVSADRNVSRRAALVGLGAAVVLGAPSVRTASAQAGGEFTYWSMWNRGEPQQRVIEAALESFTAETGIKVTTQWVGRNNLQRLAPTLNSANVPADLVDGAQRNIKSVLVSTDSHMDLVNVLRAPIPGEGGKTIASVIPESYFSSLRKNGQHWIIPYELITSMWWYDEANLPQVAKAPPKSWDSFSALLAERKSAGKAPIALDGDISNFNLYYFAEIAVRLLGPNGLRDAISDRSGQKLKDPRILRTAQIIEKLVKDGMFAKGYDSGKWPAQQQLWATNQADLIYMGPWIASEVTTYARPGFAFRSFPMPLPAPGAVDSVEVSFIGFGVPKKAKHTAEAAKFISYFMNKDRLSGIATTAINLTPRPDIPVPTQLSDAKQAIERSPNLHNQFDGMIDDYADFVTKVLVPLTNELVFGKRTAEDFQTQLVAQSAKYWELR